MAEQSGPRDQRPDQDESRTAAWDPASEDADDTAAAGSAGDTVSGGTPSEDAGGAAGPEAAGPGAVAAGAGGTAAFPGPDSGPGARDLTAPTGQWSARPGPGVPDDGTRYLGAAAGGMPPAQDPWLDQAQTEVHPRYRGGDQTRPLPPAGDDGRWAGRAGVRPGGAPAPTWIREERVEPERQPGRVWWTPIIIGIIVLILLVMLGVGLWLALRGSQNTPAPAASQSASAAPTSVAPSPTPTQAPSPTSPASPTADMVTVPTYLVGLTYDAAVQALQGINLQAARSDQVDDAVPAGTVIDTRPKPGQQVPAGGTVTLIVAVPSPTTAAASPTPASPTPAH